MTDKQMIFKCDVDYIRKNTEECFELDCIKGQESILKQLKAKEQECERLNLENFDLNDKLQHTEFVLKTADETIKLKEQQLDQLKAENKNLNNTLDNLLENNLGLRHALTEIEEIVDGMHDLWINKTPYTDIDNLVVHLLECELNRIRYKFDDISEVDDESYLDNHWLYK